VPRHAPGYRVDSVFHGHAAILENTGKFAHGMLRLRRGQAVTGHKYYFVGVRQLHRDVFEADLAHFALIALAFPKFSDGRAFSTARLLRDKHGYTGELRAVGNVLSDQIPLMRRVGFDSYEVAHAPTRRALEQGRIAEVSLHYQPAQADEPPAGTRPWLRRIAR